MMQANELQQRLVHVENTVHDAARRCESAQAVPMDIKNCMHELDQKIGQARNMMQSNQGEEKLRQYVDDLEELGDRAKDACEHSKGNVDAELKNAIMQAHRELSDLKHQLH
ncbi:hypothetical protein EGT07_26385 [Herbaspirillum sp. HC18]|nr:hypothetical protein EGT07_26385 [Herbaspirillum sp. HC18]